MPFRLLLQWALLLSAPFAPLAAPEPGKPAPVPCQKLLVLGHAGSGFFTPISPFNPLPPSSLRGVLHALDRGADGVEIDLQLSRDSTVMLYHDQRLESITTGSGCVAQHSAAELTALRYRKGWPYDWFQHERPVTLDTVLARLNRRSSFPVLHLDLQEENPCAPPGDTFDHTPKLVRQLVGSLRRAHVPAARLLAISNKAGVLKQLRAAWPALPLAFDVTDDFAGALRQAQALHVPTLVASGDRTTPAEVAQARAVGVRVILFGGRSGKDIRRILKAEPDGIQVDNMGRLLAIRRRGK